MYVGIDLHKRYMQVAVLDGDRNLIENTRIYNHTDHHALKIFLDKLDRNAKIALESSSVWYAVYRFIRKQGFDVVLSNPLKTKAIAYAKIKTDKIDAQVLAYLLSMDYLPTCKVKTEEEMDAANLARHRKYLVDSRTGYKNKIHSILLMNGIRTIHLRFTKDHRAELRQLQEYRINSYVNVIETLNADIRDTENRIKHTVEEKLNHNAKLLSTIPGVGYYSALVIASEIGDVTRFSDSSRLCSYAGLVPSTYSSGGKVRHGGITKEGNSFLRSVLSECVLAHRRVDKGSRLSKFHSKIARKKGNPKATVATAAKLLKICYWLLVEQREYSKEMKTHHPHPASESISATINTLVV